MCGFSGIISKDILPDLGYLNDAKKYIANRGPDAFNQTCFTSAENNFYFQHSRLSILDLNESANQPFIKDDYTLVFNGEIYNYREIKKELVKKSVKFLTDSDTEVVLEAYKQWGAKCLDKFIGMFAFSLHDSNRNTITLARDRAGVKPLYYYIDKDLVVFSSDLFALKHLSQKKFDLNMFSVQRFFEVGYTDNNSTYFNQVHKVESGSYISIDLDTFEYNKIVYWNPLDFFNGSKQKNETKVLEELEYILESSFNYRMVSDVPVGVFLSGGYDSSLVAAILKKKLKHDITCFTIGFENDLYDESKYAKEVASHLGVNHKSYTCTLDDTRDLLTNLTDAYDEPFGDSSAIPTLLVSKYASKDVKVVLSADGGDEVFAGYERYSQAISFYKKSKLIPQLFKNGFQQIPDQALLNISNLVLNKEFNINHIEKFKSLLNKNTLLEVTAGLVKNPNTKIFSSNANQHLHDYDIGDLNSLLLHDYKNYMESDILKKVDRATMYYSIEGREPLIDHRIFEFMAGVDETLKIKNSVKKYLLKEITHKYVPKRIMDRPKKGFSIPINKIIHEDKRLYELFFDTISDEEIGKLDFLNFKELTNCKNQYKKNYNNNFISLWYLFNFVNWNNKIQSI